MNKQYYNREELIRFGGFFRADKDGQVVLKVLVFLKISSVKLIT